MGMGDVLRRDAKVQPGQCSVRAGSGGLRIERLPGLLKT